MLSTTALFADTHGPYDRDTAYIGGLSRQLFNVDRNDITIATEIFFKEVVSRIGYEKMEFIVHDNIPDLLIAMREDRLDTVFANPIDYLELDHQVNSNHRYTVAYGPNPEQRIYLLTNSSNAITSIKQLKGKRLSIPKNYLLGRMFLEIQLARAGFSDIENFFSIVHEPNSTNAAVLDLFFDKADLAVTSEISYTLASELNPQLSRKIDILSSSPPYIPFIIGVNKQAPNEHLAKVDSILSQIENEPRLKHILSLFSATSVTKVTEGQLQALRKLKQEHQRQLE
jgi:ABC-type phosphate/phosphonate transport system substrate-binding protein